jgi:hypothetical protein
MRGERVRLIYNYFDHQQPKSLLAQIHCALDLSLLQAAACQQL